MSEHNTCSTCMFFDDFADFCDKHSEESYPYFECNDHKEKVQ